MRTRTIDNSTYPMLTPDGQPWANTEISFILVDSNGKPTDTFDAVTKERICGKTTVRTDGYGCFSVALFPNNRGEKNTQYYVHVDNTYTNDFKATLLYDLNPISLFDFRLSGDIPTEQEVITIQQYIRNMIDDVNHSTNTTYSSQFIYDAMASLQPYTMVYNGDGTVLVTNSLNSYLVTYNEDGTVDTINDGQSVGTLSYDGQGRYTGITIVPI